MMLLSLSMMMMSFFMFFLTHPLSMGLMILLQTIFICLLTGMLINTYWFSYILFLTFLGGLLVLFIYVSSIASNELFKNNFFFNKIIILIFFIIIMMNLMFIFKLNWMNPFFNEEMYNFFNINIFFNNENKINLSKLYNNQTFLMMMMMIIYLFIALVAVVKITNIFFGPLRSSM
uniref:NADH-ubiquinone oxidoreductase chain 6 n=1 Tax=Grapholita delineana TaxID=1178106 RepID=A0A8F4MEC1_9NEOP|nr:NADH dehydrogenase subunit 6 [Grapholita delineana]UDU84771.1 NADH dehydrogenase subunit 6 [Grapholita delineana]UDU84797.1 NADH dehydrogenase subunit 6 [Grapholita delineana]UDU84810.1 NADH dehydrogenase subunit 6 [Grapholita delineana]UDU84823.1 NADH dehydrogenase subunit 6 [Grapholita delineana]